MPTTRRRKILLILGGLILGAFCAIAFTSWRGVPFPEPTGKYHVGRTSYHFTDKSRVDSFSPQPGDRRELMVTVHYPTEASRPPSPYASARLAAALGEAFHLPAFTFGLARSHAAEGAPCAGVEGGFPVVIFSPGFNSPPLFYTATLEELASHGFIVASISHPYSTIRTVFPDGRVVAANEAGTRFEIDAKKPDVSRATVRQERDAIGKVWLADIRFVLDSLAGLNEGDATLGGRFDLNRVGVFGHSFGGAAAAAAVQTDRRIKAGINLDGTDFSDTQSQRIKDSFLWVCAPPRSVAGSHARLPDVRREPPGAASGTTTPGMAVARKGGDLESPAAGPGSAAHPVSIGRLPPAERPPSFEEGAEKAKKPPARMIRGRDGAEQPFDPEHGFPPSIPAESRVVVEGAEHQTFTSDPVLQSATLPFSWLSHDQAVGSIEGRRAVSIVNTLVVSFFRKHLRGEDVPLLDSPSAVFPEVRRTAAEH